MKFIRDRVPLGENGIEMMDELSVIGKVSGKILSIRTSENADDGDRGEDGVQRKSKGEGGGITSNAFR